MRNIILYIIIVYNIIINNKTLLKNTPESAAESPCSGVFLFYKEKVLKKGKMNKM